MHTAHDYNYILVFKICQGVLLTFTKLPCEPCSTLRDNRCSDHDGDDDDGGAVPLAYKPQPTDGGGDDIGDDADGFVFPAQ